MMKLRTGPEADRRLCRLGCLNSGGEGAIAFAAAAPLLVLAVAVAADHAQVSRFRTQVQLAAEAASIAASEAIARRPDSAGDGARIAAAVFVRNAPRGAMGTPSVAATTRGAVVTATVAYDGVAPSSFGSALGYGAFRVNATATSHALVADLQAAATP
jgi:Flp pilus assembly protein TadG